MEDKRNETPFEKKVEIYGKQIETIPKPERNIGIDTDNTLLWDLASVQAERIDLSEIDKFTNISDSRNQLYSLIDQMAADSRIASALEIYSEDSTEKNAQGRIVWAESNDSNITKYVNFLLNSLNVDKNVYKWVYSLCKYGDVYVRLFRESDVEDDLFKEDDELEKKSLNEDVKVKAYSKDDNFVHYVEMVPNPAEMFELTKFGKTYAYIKAPSDLTSEYDYKGEESWLMNSQSTYRYKFKRNDVNIYQATEFVHACLEDDPSRFPETVSIFRTDADYNADKDADVDAGLSLNYSVRRGSSLLSNIFKLWRELMLLENAVLLNRITKSSILRVIQVEVGDMPKEKVQPHIHAVKELIEQKSAISVGNKLSEYTNPGPIENNVYIPTRNGQGVLTTNQIGGDVDVKSLADLDYFLNKIYGALRIPKQYMGDTDDSTGFNGGTALSLISSSFAKMVKRIQSTMIQMITDMINLLLLDKGMKKYLGNFSIHMVEPMTEEDKNRQENISAEIQVASDIMGLLSDIEDPVVKLKLLKALISNTITNDEVLDLIQQQIDELEEQAAQEESIPPEDDEEDMNVNVDIDHEGPSDFRGGSLNDEMSTDLDLEGSEEAPAEAEAGGETADELPSMNDIGLDFADSTQF